MVRMSRTRRLTAATVLMALLSFTGEPAAACVHREGSDGHASLSDGGSRAMPGAHLSCHGVETNHGANGTPDSHAVAATVHEGMPHETAQVCHSDSSETDAECCAGGCCASPGIPLTSAEVASVGAPTRDQLVSPPSSPVTGELPGVLRPPIG